MINLHLSWPSKILLFMSMTAYLLITYWLFWPYTPIIIHEVKIVNKGAVYAGGVLQYEVDYSKKHDFLVVAVTRQLINGAVVLLKPGELGYLPLGNHRKAFIEIPIPEYACAKKGHLRIVASYQVNPLRVVHIKSISDEFEVQKKASGDHQ